MTHHPLPWDGVERRRRVATPRPVWTDAERAERLRSKRAAFYDIPLRYRLPGFLIAAVTLATAVQACTHGL